MEHKIFRIGEIIVGGSEPLVIPEIGINHNGSLEVAMEMVDAAYRAGARLVKHQTHIVDDEMCGSAKTIKPGNADISIYEVMKRAALCEEDEEQLKNYVESKGMVFLSTPFSRAAAERLEKMNVKAYKIGSGEMNNYPLLSHIASYKKPMIVSTGMNNIWQIDMAVNILEKAGVPYALMHTTNLYPTPPHLVRLGGMQKLMQVYPNIPIGLSDHTTNNNACIAAIALGAKIVERHFTDIMDRIGPDISCSMDEAKLSDLLQAAKEVPQMLGGNKEAALEEQVTIDFAFASVVTIKDIKKGEPFSCENIWVKRPGTGEILAVDYPAVLGNTAIQDIPTDTQVAWNMIDR